MGKLPSQPVRLTVLPPSFVPKLKEVVQVPLSGGERFLFVHELSSSQDTRWKRYCVTSCHTELLNTELTYNGCVGITVGAYE